MTPTSPSQPDVPGECSTMVGDKLGVCWGVGGGGGSERRGGGGAV